MMLIMVEQSFSEGEYFRIGEAADYVGVSAQTLRRWDKEGRISPLRHPRNGYRYYRRAELEPFRLEYQRAADEPADPDHLFQRVNANIEANELLREPQRDAHRKVREHFAQDPGPAILQIPVGCGKTGIMATLPFGITCGRVLIITPNLTIRKGVAAALDIASRECFWAKTRVLSDFQDGPYFAVLDSNDANIHDCTESHFVVTNIQQLASSADRWLPQFPPNFFDMILIDEGHHAAAASWQKVLRRFPEAKVVSLTATPFRSDEQPLEGEVIYSYPFARAMLHGFIKRIVSRSVAPSELYFTIGEDSHRHSLEEVLELREEQWFRRGVALSPECNRHIAEASIQRCNRLRSQTGIPHQIIAAACSVDHARQVRAIYEECGYRAAEIHSEMSEAERERVFDELDLGRLDCIVQVQMLGEGFDHPRLSVAAVFRPFRSLAPYIQFVGRVMRVVVQDQPEHPDNLGFVVSHVGLNNEERWEEFTELDLEDQRLIHQWLQGEGDEDEDLGGGGGGPRRFDEITLVDSELVSHFVDAAFMNPEDDRMLDEHLARQLPGLNLTLGDVMTREQLREKLREQNAELEEDPVPIPVTPQRRRKAARARLHERAGSVVARILDDLGISRPGRDISRVLGGPPAANVQRVTVLLNQEINEFTGIRAKSRKQLSADQAEDALGALDAIGDQVRDQLREKLEAG